VPAVTKPKHYKELQVWQKGMLLAQSVYRLTGNFPQEERYGLVTQMRRAAVSVPSNIAEGQARQGTREFLLFLSHAMGSLAELETQLVLSESLGFCGTKGPVEILRQVDELQRMLRALRKKLSGRP
jgi:four helix bundle protein